MRFISILFTGLLAFSSFLANAEQAPMPMVAPLYDNASLYKASLTSYNWIEASEQADVTPITLDDDDTELQTIAFPFSFYNVEYNQLIISSNGFISFDDNSGDECCEGASIPQQGRAENYIAGWHSDLDPDSGGFVTTATYGTAPNRIFIVQFDEIRACCGTDEPQVSFQYQLHENSQNIEVHYKSIDSYDQLLTIGIENSDGTDGIEFFHGFDDDFVASYPDALIAIKYRKTKVKVSYNSTQTSEFMNNITIDVALNTAPTADVVIPVMSDNISEGTVDINSLTFTSANWNTPQTITVTGVDDEVLDGDTNYNIVLGTSTSDDLEFSDIDSVIALVNVDNETPGVFLSDFSSKTLVEGSSIQFMVSLNTQPTADVTFEMDSTPNIYTDRFVMTPASLTFTADNFTTPQLVTITYAEDTLALLDSNVAIDFTAISTDVDYLLTTSADVVAINNDIAGIIVETTGSMTYETGKGFEVNVSLATPPVGEILILVAISQNYATLNLNGSAMGTGFLLIFDASNWDQAQTVVVQGIDNDNVDSTEDQNFILVVASNDYYEDEDSAYAWGRFPIQEFDITHDDDDVIEVALSNIGALLVNEDGTATTLDLSLNNLPTADVSVTVTSANEDEIIVSTASYLFTPDNWNALQSLELVGVNDDLVDGNQTVEVTITTTSTDVNYNALIKTLTVSNADNDTASIVVDVMDAFTTSELGGNQILNFMLSTQPSADVSFELYSTDTTEGDVSSSLITFTADNWNVAQAVTVSGQADLVIDGDVAYEIMFKASKSEDALYNGLTLTALSVTNIDDIFDYSFTVSATSLTVTEGQTVSFDVVLNAPPSEDVIVPLYSSDTNEAVLSTETLIFTAENWNTAQTVTVSGVEEGVVDEAQSIFILFLPVESDDVHYDAFAVTGITLLVENATEDYIEPSEPLEKAPVEEAPVEEAPAEEAPTTDVTIVEVPLADEKVSSKSSGGSINFLMMFFLMLIVSVRHNTKK